MPTTIKWIDFILKIRPLPSKFHPYFGFGIGNYFLDRAWDHGVDHTNRNGDMIYKGNLEDKIGYQMVLGLRPDSGPYVELKYIILNTSMNRGVDYFRAENVTNGELNVNLNTLLIMVGISF